MLAATLSSAKDMNQHGRLRGEQPLLEGRTPCSATTAEVQAPPHQQVVDAAQCSELDQLGRIPGSVAHPLDETAQPRLKRASSGTKELLISCQVGLRELAWPAAC